jgi:hypothetical protein
MKKPTNGRGRGADTPPPPSPMTVTKLWSRCLTLQHPAGASWNVKVMGETATAKLARGTLILALASMGFAVLEAPANEEDDQ